MDCVNNNNDTIVYEKPNTIIGRKLKGATECGKCNICYNEDTGNKNLYTQRSRVVQSIVSRTQEVHNMRYMRLCQS